ncbi:MAG: cytochrome P450 [Sandaracinus sp.]
MTLLDEIARAMPRRSSRRAARLPPGPSLPPIAQGALFVLRMLPFFERCRARYGSTFSLRIPTQPPIVVFSDEAPIREIFGLRPEDVSVGAALDWMEPFVGRHSLLLMDGERHLRERRLLLPPFHGSRMHAYGDAIREIARRAMDEWPLERLFAIEPAARAITLDIILRTVFGASGAELEALRQAVLDVLAQFSVFNIVSALRFDLGELTPWGRFVARRAALDQLLFRLIRERRAAGPRDRDDVLTMLLEARYEDGQPMRDEELRDELITLVGAGHETSTSALAWAFQCLAHHPDAQARARAELDAAPSEPAELPWIDAIVKETLRYHAVFPLVGRVLQRPQTIGGWDLPAGTLVYVSIHLTHRNPAHWSHPERFDPERFLDARPPAFGYLPFGGGSRRCIGMQYALYEMRGIVAEALRRFRIAPAGAPEPAITHGLTLAPSRGARVRLSAR